MSHFIAHTITFSKDFKTYRLKGGDNNVVPRMNYWIGTIPIQHLYDDLNGGMVRLTGTSEKNCFIRHLVNSMDFGGNWNEKTDYYHACRYGNAELSEKVQKFNDEFESALIKGIKGLKKNPKVIIKVGMSYVIKSKGDRLYTSWHSYDRDRAKQFGLYHAKDIARKYPHSDMKLIEVK